MVQQLIVAVVVLVSVLFVARRMWRAIASARAPKGSVGCDTGCGCSTTHTQS